MIPEVETCPVCSSPDVDEFIDALTFPPLFRCECRNCRKTWVRADE